MSLAFFNTLFPDTGSGRDLGYAVIALFPEGEFSTSSGPTELHWFAWPSQKDTLAAFCLANHTFDLYTSPCLYKTKGERKADKISHQWAAYADADTLDLNKVKAEPTMVVQTSPGRHHLYWITEVDNTERLTELSRAIAHTHAADGCDKGGWDAGQLLRIPGSTNNKYRLFDGSPCEVQLKAINTTYSIAKLEEIYPTTGIPDAPAASEMPPRSDWHNHPDVLTQVQELFTYSPIIEDMATARLRPGQDRSDTMWRFLGELARNGASRNTAMYLGWEAPFNKYRLDGRPEEELWAEVCRAFDHPANKAVTNSIQAAVQRTMQDAGDDAPDNPRNKARKVAESISLLTPGEREQVSRDTFVDNYVEWAKTCTDAPEVYHRSGALTILTSVFGEFGRCPVKRDANLTLWFMILGPTTRARKTTSQNLWVDILADIQDKRYDYLFTSDATSEALNLELPKRDGRTSVFFRDEAHGLFAEQDKKMYMAGLRERMTDLYSGRVPIVKRASTISYQKDEDEDAEKHAVKVRTNFVMSLSGTTNQVTEVLTIKDYQSGHLARFIIAEADPPPMTREAMYTEQYDGSDELFDGRRHTLINQLTDARDFWQQLTPPGALKLIPFDPDAWERLQYAQWQLYEPTIGHEMHDLMEATAKRMGDSLMKTAVLLAMAERKRVVSLPHVYKAMELAEEWYGHAVGIAGRIMHSSWSGFQEEILGTIRSRLDGVTQAEIYSRFRTKMQEKDIESALNVLVKAGLVSRIPTGGRVRYLRTSRT